MLSSPDRHLRLAVEGGPPVRSHPFPARRTLGSDETLAITTLMRRAELDGCELRYAGPEQRAYEREFETFHGGGHARLVSSGTAGLYALLLALELQRPGEVIAPAITDAGGVMPVALADYSPIPADTVRGSFIIGVKQIERCISPTTRAIILAHIGGDPADIKPIVELAQARGLILIEDCSQAHGATYHGAVVGTFGHAAVFSTMVGKHHCTGGQGGVVLTSSTDLAERLDQCIDRGKVRSSEGDINVRAALNLNGSDIAAAIGRVQLRKLSHRLARRRELAARLTDATFGFQLRPVPQSPGTESAYWFVRIGFEPNRWSRVKRDILAALRAEGVPVTSWGDMPHKQPWYASGRVFGPGSASWKTDLSADPTPEASKAIETHFTVPLHERWTDREIDDVAAAFAKVEAAYMA
jgi:dTDP-4-amino-4,6-dideoxygalactose transaminase